MLLQKRILLLIMQEMVKFFILQDLVFIPDGAGRMTVLKF